MPRYQLQTPENVAQAVAAKVRALRLRKGWKQATLAHRSGVSLATLRRFETSGKVSFQTLLKLVFALGRLNDFDHLMESPEASSMAELEERDAKPRRKRGRL